MAHSVQMFGQNSAQFSDLDLIVIMCFMIDEVEREPGTYPQISRLASEWAQALAAYGPGTIDMKLDLVASSQESRTCLDRLLQAVDARIKRFGEAVPSSILNMQRRVPGVSFVDFPSVLLTDALDELRKLVWAAPAPPALNAARRS